jgi:hypothetical protein
LERVSTGDLLRGHPELVAPKYEAIARAQAEGRIVPDLRPDEVYALVIALAGTWSPSSATYTAAAADDEPGHERRRQALRSVVARALVPESAPAAGQAPAGTPRVTRRNSSFSASGDPVSTV